MAKSISNKLWTATLGKIHSIIDKAYNTPESYAQCIRDLEKALANTRASHDEAVGQRNGIQHEIDELHAKISKYDADITLLLTDGDESNDDAALAMQIQVDKWNEDIEDFKVALADAQESVAQLAFAISQGENKRSEMARNLKKIQLTAKTTTAKNQAADAIQSAREAFDESGSIDSIAGRINAEARTADAKFQRVVGELGTESPEQAAAKARAKKALEERKAALTGTTE